MSVPPPISIDLIREISVRRSAAVLTVRGADTHSVLSSNAIIPMRSPLFEQVYSLDRRLFGHVHLG